MPRVASLFLVSATLSCAHHPRGDPRSDAAVIAEVQRHQARLDRLPRCGPNVATIGFKQLRAKALDDPVAVRGRLQLAARTECTAMACPESHCNQCFPEWVVVLSDESPSNGGPGHEVPIQRPGDPAPWSGLAMDCQMPALRERIAKPEVIASGTLLKGTSTQIIFDASLCVVQQRTP
jgi:hypothetical protein